MFSRSTNVYITLCLLLSYASSITVTLLCRIDSMTPLAEIATLFIGYLLFIFAIIVFKMKEYKSISLVKRLLFVLIVSFTVIFVSLILMASYEDIGSAIILLTGIIYLLSNL